METSRSERVVAKGGSDTMILLSTSEYDIKMLRNKVGTMYSVPRFRLISFPYGLLRSQIRQLTKQVGALCQFWLVAQTWLPVFSSSVQPGQLACQNVSKGVCMASNATPSGMSSHSLVSTLTTNSGGEARRAQSTSAYQIMSKRVPPSCI